MSGVAVELEGVTKLFQQGPSVTEAIGGATFSARAEEFVSLIGPSGCGKTTVMRIIGDLLTPTSGSVKVGGQSPVAARKARKFGFVFQDATLLGWQTMLDNVILPLKVIGTPQAAARARGEELLDLVGLREFARHYPDQVSGGMRQRGAIARALSFDPEVLLMDEPLGALDMITRDRMAFELLRIWQEQRKTVLFVTHSIQEAVLLSDKVVVFSARPARVLEVVRIELPRPRTAAHRDSPQFHAYTHHLRELLQA